MCTKRDAFLGTLVGVVILAALVAFYIDDRSRTANESAVAGQAASQHDHQHGDSTPAMTSSGVTSLTLDEYLAKSAGQRAFSDGYGGAYTKHSGGGEDATSAGTGDHAAAQNLEGHVGFDGSYQSYVEQYH